jgi:putative salt-induced outer membrane protein YdiY
MLRRSLGLHLRCHRASLFALPCCLLLSTVLAPGAVAQVTLKPDGQWRHLVSAGLNVNTGTTRSNSLRLGTDSVRATATDKWTLAVQALYASAAGTTTGERFSITTQHNQDLNRRVFSFVQAGAQHDRPGNLRERVTVTGGLGLHLMRADNQFWDVWAGLALGHERYFRPSTLRGMPETRRSSAGLVLAQESSVLLGSNARLRQKLTLTPDLRDNGGLRTEFDVRISVSLNATISMSTGLGLRHNNRPPPRARRFDSALTSGLSWRFD